MDLLVINPVMSSANKNCTALIIRLAKPCLQTKLQTLLIFLSVV